MSGWYRSTDGGSTWNMLDFYQLCTDVDYGFGNGFMCAMAYDPVNPDKVYGYGRRQDLNNNPSQLMVSLDAGATWSVLTASPAWGADRVTVICIDRANASFMLVGTEAGVYTSTDGGTTFTGPGVSSGYIQGLMVDQRSATGSRTCYAGSWNGIFKSVNNGATWTAANNGLPSTNSSGFCGASNATSGRLYEIDGSNGDLYTSTDASSWTLSGSGDWFGMVACSDNDTSTAYAINTSDRSVWKTSNAGGTWAKALVDTNPAPNASMGWISYDLSFSWGSPNTMLCVDKADSNRCMFTNYGETFLSDDAGATWQEAYSTYSDTAPRAAAQKWASRGLEMTTSWQYVIDPNNPNYHYICYTDIGFARSTDAGQTWYDTARKGTVSQAWTNTFYQIAFNPTPGVIIAAVGGLHDIDHSWPLGRAGSGGIAKSTDYGATWAPASTGMPVSPTTSVVFDPVNNVYFAASWGNGVYKSTSAAGTNWAATAPVAIGTNHDVYSLKLVTGKLYCLLSAQKTYANAGGLFVSANQGAGWTNIALNFGGHALKYPADFDVNPQDPNIIFIAAQDCGGYSDGGLWKSTNGGASWALMNMPVGHTPYGYAAMIDPGNTNNVYYSTEGQGLFGSTDGGTTWARVTGIPFASPQHMTFDTNYTYVTTFGGGVWKQAAGAAPTGTQTAIPPASFTPTGTMTTTQVITATNSATPSVTGTPTATMTATPSMTGTLTATITLTPTVTDTVNPLWTATDTDTITATYSDTLTSTCTPTFTITITASPQVMQTATPSGAATATATPVNTPAGAFEVTGTILYPDPVTGSGDFTLRLECTGAPVSVRMRIYTVSFRLIRDIRWGADEITGNFEVKSGPGELGGVATGIYYYSVSASDASGSESRPPDKPMVVISK